MYATAVFTALVSLVSVAQAAPVEVRKEAPSTYFEGYLEPYATYHARYLAIGCSQQHGTQFFSDCCRPMLATETLEQNRLPYCWPNATASDAAAYSSYLAAESATPAAGASATPTASADVQAASEYSHESASVASYVESASALPSVSSIDYTSAAAATSSPAYVQAAAPSASPSPSANSGSSSGGDVKTGGYATYFYQNGNAGACGQVHSDSEYGIAIDSNGYWGNNFGSPSSYCGQQIQITNTDNGKTVTATVWDVCPTCTNDNSLDLSVGAFTAIASESQGMVPISWQFV